ncbi:MAG: hypothetical protein S0880_25965 [Actinomycetota bacterium]|nr:hypothetical protein [Actinomycetota bacterium]
MTDFEIEMLQRFRQTIADFPTAGDLDAMSVMRSGVERQIGQLESSVAPRLDAILTGPAVEGHKIDVKFLVSALAPLQEAVTAIGQALDFTATSRAPVPGAVRDVTSMKLAATFAGSFGLRLEGPTTELEEQVELDLAGSGPTRSTFERSVETLFDAIDAAEEDNYEENVRAVMSKMGRRGVVHLRALAVQFSSSTNRMTLVSTSGAEERRTVIARTVAERIATVADATEMQDVETRVRGRLVGASLARKTFELETEDETLIKGSVGPNALGYLSRYLDTECVALLNVTSATSRIDGSASPSYLLLSLE